MGILDMFSKKKPTKQVNVKSSSGKTSGTKLSNKTTFETSLNGVKAKNRQEVLMGLGKNDSLKLDPILTSGTLGFEVFTLDKNSIGTIPPKVSNELEIVMGSGLEPYITNYILTKDKDEIYNCKVTLGLNKK